MTSSLTTVAHQTHACIEAGAYDVDGRQVSIQAAVQRAQAATCLYEPDSFSQLRFASASLATQIEVTSESTLVASRRLGEGVVALNFASARNAGGGWLGGARAQEESLARASALVATLETQPKYYQANRAERSLLYSDHLIYSPRVPVFRTDAHDWLPEPYEVSFITSPAPNAGAIAKNAPEELALVEPTVRRRARQMLLVAATQGHRKLVLGAWGCGAFRCSPQVVARVFAELLASSEVRGCFETVVFPIFGGRPGWDTLAHFKRELLGA